MTFEHLVDTAPPMVREKLESLKKLRERPDFHPEENTYEHVRIVVERLITTDDPDLIMTGLFHDLFKLDCVVVGPTGHPSSPGHETEAEKLITTNQEVRDFISLNGADPDNVAFMCGQHMRVKRLGEMNHGKRNAILSHRLYPSLLTFTLADRMLMNWDESRRRQVTGDKELPVGDVTFGWIENAVIHGKIHTDMYEQEKEKSNKMSAHKITGKNLLSIGFKQGPVISVAMQVAEREFKHTSLDDMLALLKTVLDSPAEFLEDAKFGKVAEFLVDKPKVNKHGGMAYKLNAEPLPYKIWGVENIEPEAIEQMNVAMRLPVTRGGALMPDTHLGYALPVGGVLAMENAVSSAMVGVDIGCRMSLTLYAVNSSFLSGHKDKIVNVINKRTSFGVGSEIDEKMDESIMDDARWTSTKLIESLKDKAHRQLGSSGGGNHAVDIGSLELYENIDGVEPGSYVAIMTHSGSRGFGAKIADFYGKISMQKCMLEGAAKGLAWLDLDSEEGLEYWLSMNLAMDYASACHRNIHLGIAKDLGWEPILRVENHHNFAAKEVINGKELIVHRKGATPAGPGVLGFIPGTMADPGFIVTGLGQIDSLNSASHGAGRAMSRTAAKNSFTMSQMNKVLEERGVTLIGSSIDESPMSYKDIMKVMSAQEDLVKVLGKFMPKIVRMATESSEF